MPLELQIIRAAEFVRVGAQGEFNLPASKAALATLAAACQKRGIQQALVDLRAVNPGPEPVFTPADLLELVKTFPEVGFAPRLRLAILYTADPHKRARLFAFLSTLHGWNVRAFGDFEEALFWLSDEPQAHTEPDTASEEQAVPIRSSQRGTGVPIRARRGRERPVSQPAARQKASSTPAPGGAAGPSRGRQYRPSKHR